MKSAVSCLRGSSLPARKWGGSSKKVGLLLGLSVFVAAANAAADDPRVHVGGGVAHAIGGTQGSEFATGGSGSASLELPVAPALGIQASAGALVLSQGDAPKDPTIARTSTGAAFLGTLGVRVRAFGNRRVAGPWIDSNVGMTQTGALTRPAFDAHLGWDVRVSRSSRLDVGPYLGYTQIFQPDSALRSDDARVLSVGIAFSLGAKERVPTSSSPPNIEEPLPPPPPPVEEAVIEEEPQDEGIRIVEDRILLDDVIHFEFDSANIRESSHSLVQRVARFINEHTDIVDISVEGHTDEVGTEEYNQKLSVARAESMREMLIEFGVEASRLHVLGHGKSLPKIVTLKREEQNRRVELFVTRQREESGSSAMAHGRNSR